jgi:chromosome segregation ATPase
VLSATAARIAAQTNRVSQNEEVLPALLIEVRGLRAAMEQMASAGPRVQLALGRLQLQEQRVNNLLRRLETARASLAAAQRNDENARQPVAWIEEELKSAVVPEAERKAAEERLASLKITSLQAARDVQRLQVEESGIVQELASEQGRWTDINQRMEEFERALTRK